MKVYCKWCTFYKEQRKSNGEKYKNCILSWVFNERNDCSIYIPKWYVKLFRLDRKGKADE